MDAQTWNLLQMNIIREMKKRGCTEEAVQMHYDTYIKQERNPENRAELAECVSNEYKHCLVEAKLDV